MALKVFTSIAKWLKLKVRKFWELIRNLLKLQGKNWWEGSFSTPPPIINRVNKDGGGFRTHVTFRIELSDGDCCRKEVPDYGVGIMDQFLIKILLRFKL